ncbi:MAG TPA: hypothetical protein VFH85_05795 [Gammaproteobacteria bacterium]|nr:hypothetical protein [Gammaproteobacteria bacterium]
MRNDQGIAVNESDTLIEDRLLDIDDVKELTHLGRTTIRRLELLPEGHQRRFPQRTYITKQTPRWSLLAVQDWIKRQTHQTTNQTTAAPEGESEAA